MSKLFLNLVPIELSGSDIFKVWTTSYLEYGALNELRRSLVDTHFVRRDGDKVEVVPFNVSENELPTEYEFIENEFNINDKPELIDYLLQGWIFRSLKEKKLTCWIDSQIHYISKKSESELLSQCVVDDSSLPKTISIRIGADFTVRRIKRNNNLIPSLAITIQKRISINEPISKLIQRGFDAKGLYVLKKENPAQKGRLAGKIVGEDNGLLLLDDFGDQDYQLDSTIAYLEPRIENLEKVIRFYLGTKAQGCLNKLHKLSSERASGPAKLEMINKLASFISKIPNDIAQGILASTSEVFSEENPNFLDHKLFYKPELIFDVSGRKTSKWNQGGLDKYGPFNWEMFSPRNLNIAVICQADKQGDVEQFLGKFLNGIPGDKYAETGFLKRYHLDKPYIKVFPISDSSASSYKTACGEALEHITEFGKKWNLCLVQIEEVFHDLHGEQNPYLVSKAYLLSKEIPVQQFEYETIQQSGFSLAASINNMGVACYAKMGGVPWVLPSSNTISHELIFGIGSYVSSSGRLGDTKRYVGVTTVFSGDGRYLLESRTSAVEYNSYQIELFKTLKLVVENIRKQEAWHDKDPVRFIFHIFKPLKNTEIEAVIQLVSELGMSHAEFAFMHVVDSHPYLMFDTEQVGESKMHKGKFSPFRGSYLKLNDRETLISLTGAKELKQVTDGLPKPVLIRLHEGSTFSDIEYLSRQVFYLSCLSWRGMLPSPAPITILYSDLIAKNIRLLSTVPGWSAENIFGPIGRSRWFL